MKERSLEYIQNKYKHKLQIYTDGSKDPDKQTSGAAFVIPEHNFQAAYKTNPILSIFTIELIAIERAIEWSIHNNIPETAILTDSLSSVQSLQSGKSHTRPDKINHILSQLDAAKTLGISIHIDWIPAHVDIPDNELADATACSAMTNGTPAGGPTPRSVLGEGYRNIPPPPPAGYPPPPQRTHQRYWREVLFPSQNWVMDIVISPAPTPRQILFHNTHPHNPNLITNMLHYISTGF